MKEDYIVVSGGFDPIHSGHIELIKHAAQISNVIVIVNNDKFLIDKKGFIFMKENQRIKILSSINGVEETFLSIDQDHTVIKSIESLVNEGYGIKFFANGGDRKDIEDIPEAEVCNKYNIELIFDIGGDKTESSSSLAHNLYDQMQLNESQSKNIVKKPWGFYKTFISEGEYLLKKIYINPGEEISEQSHYHRDEHWVVVSGSVLIQTGKDSRIKKKNDYIFIDKKLKHKITNNSDVPAIIIEVQTGVVLSEDDIIRYNDKYNRS